MAEQIRRKIYMLRRDRTPPIDIAVGSEMPIALEFMDYTIPSGATVKVYASPFTRETTYVQDATVIENTVVFTPVDGFFQQGWNSLQPEINGNKIPLAVDVNCGIRLSDGGEGVAPEAVRPLVERAEEAAKAAEGSKTQAQSSAASAAGSQKAAATSEANAASSASAAITAANAAATSEANATASAKLADDKRVGAWRSEQAAKTSETNAAASASSAAESQTAAATSEENAASSAAAAQKAETAAKKSADTVTAAAEKITANETAISTLLTRLKSGKVEDAELHLGFYLDSNGDLCQKED